MTTSLNTALRTVHLVEFTMIPGNTYSAPLGYLQAAAQAEPDLAAALTFKRHVASQYAETLNRGFAEIMASLDDPLAVAFTVYFWNRPATVKMARLVKERWPDCQIVLGGNDVTNQQETVFTEAPVDVLVHGEGEIRFAELLRRFLHSAPGDDRRTVLADIPGISYRAHDGEIVTTPAAERIADLADVPSPILSSVYSDADLASSRLFVYETNRGCPYSCAFCYWGGAINSKVRQFPLERIQAELDRIIRNASPYAQIFIADANFGILPRDVEIAKSLVETCRRYDKRVVIQTNWAKNTSERVVTIAHMLHSAKLSGAITLSAQSFDPEVLQIANRSNIRVEAYRRLQQRFHELEIPTYTDLIWGLPGEGPESLRTSIEEVFQAGGSAVIYPLLLLNNTEYTKERYRTGYDIQHRHLPCNPGVNALTADVVVAHSAMTIDEWVDGLMLRLAVDVFQKSLLRCTLRILSHQSGARIVDLCDHLKTYLVTECSDPGLVALARNHGASWRDPEDYDDAIVRAEIGGIKTAIDEELHFQAVLARFVRDPAKLRNLVLEATDYLCARLNPDTLPSRAQLEGLVGLDVAAGAALRAGLVRRPEETYFDVGDENMMKILRSYDDVPADLPAKGGFSASIQRANYPFTAYYLSVFHGSGRPLHDLTPIAAQH